MEEITKIALVTGGSRGLGKDMALQLAGKGIHVILTYLTKQEEAAMVVSEIEEKGVKAVAVQFNAGDIKSFIRLSSNYRRRWNVCLVRTNLTFS